MNIFFLSADPTKAAQAHCDKHVVKMILESTQLLWTAHWVIGDGPPEDAPICVATGRPGYRPVSKNHPCAIWVRQSRGNYLWLVELAQALIGEYHYRWPQRRAAHACEAHIAWLADHIPARITAIPMTAPAQAMPAEYKRASPTAAYKAYYMGEKRRFARWTIRESPVWWIAGSTDCVGREGNGIRFSGE